MPLPALAIPLIQGLGQAIPSLFASFFGGHNKKGEKERNLAEAERLKSESALLALRRQLGLAELSRQQELAPMFSMFAGPNGLARLLPNYMREAINFPTPPPPGAAVPPGTRVPPVDPRLTGRVAVPRF